MTAYDWIAVCLVSVGLIFFIVGSIGLLRFPDLFTRLHALTKADNLGLGFIVFGLSLYSGSWVAGIKMVFIWILVMISSAVVSHLIAQAALREGIEPWRNT